MNVFCVVPADYLKTPPPRIAIGSAVTVPPAIFEQVPFGTRTHAWVSRSCLAVPAHELTDVPQSFFPPAAMPAHFSYSAAFAL